MNAQEMARLLVPPLPDLGRIGTAAMRADGGGASTALVALGSAGDAYLGQLDRAMVGRLLARPGGDREALAFWLARLCGGDVADV